jgi:hypothetical protein
MMTGNGPITEDREELITAMIVNRNPQVEAVLDKYTYTKATAEDLATLDDNQLLALGAQVAAKFAAVFFQQLFALCGADDQYFLNAVSSGANGYLKTPDAANQRDLMEQFKEEREQ